jgi:hypothetical protein
MRAAHCGDVAGVTGCGKPIVNRSPDSPAPNRRIAGPMVAGDQQHEALATHGRLVESAIDGPPGRIEAETMEIEDSVWLDCSAAQPPVPACVQSRIGVSGGLRCRPQWRGRCRPSRG